MSSTIHRLYRPRLVWVGYLLPVLAFLVLRLAILATNIDRLGHLADGEIAHADLAWDLEEGHYHPPLWSYQVVPFHGGTFVSTLLFVPWSRVFGDEYASLKGLALAYALVAMLLWMWTLNRVSGPGAAMVFGWLYALAPPVLVRMQLTLWSTHPELNALLAASTAFATLTTTSRPQHRPVWRVLFGMSVGFAIYFNFSAAVFEAPLLMAVLFGRQTRGRGQARRRVSSRMLVVLGIAAGLLPLALGAMAGASTLAVYGQGPRGLLAGASIRLTLLPRLAAIVPPLSPQVPPGPPMHMQPARVLLAIVLLGSCLALAAGARWVVHSARSIFRAVGAYPLLFLPVLAAIHLPFTTSTAGTFGYCPRYVATVYPVLYAVLALATMGFLSRDERTRQDGTRPGASSPPTLTRGRLARLTAASVSIVAVFYLTVPSLVDDLQLVDLSSPRMASRFTGVRLFRAGLRGVDRRSLDEALRYLDLESTGAVPPGVARCVRAVLAQPWHTDFWRFLSLPPDGPSTRTVADRVKLASQGGTDAACRAGLAWGADIALGRHPDPQTFLSIPPPDP